MVDSQTIEKTLQENTIERSDLIDTNTALKIGTLLGAQYIITGTVIELSESVVVFCRIVDVPTGAIISVSQVILPKSSEIRALL